MTKPIIAQCLDQAAMQIMDAKRIMKENWESFVNAPFDIAKQHLTKADQLLVEALQLQSTDVEGSMIKAKLASSEAMDGYLHMIPSRTAEARGVWYRAVESSREEVSSTLDRMKVAGFNELYLETWLWGYTIFPSRTAKASHIEEQHPAFRGWDPLTAFVEEGKKRGIAVHAWLDGFMVGVDPTGGPVLRAYPEWSAVSRRHANSEKPMSQSGTGYFWLDITNPGVRQYLLDIVKEIITSYGVAGINLDFMRFPHASEEWEDSYGFSAHAREAFGREHGMDPLEIHAVELLEPWTTWMKWLERIEDDFIAELYKEIKGISAKVIISAAPEPGAESDKIGNWSQYVDVVIPQAYYDNSMQVRESVLRHQNELTPGNLVYSGIYPMYAKLGDQETVAQVLAARDIDKGTVIFAFGQATYDIIRALRMGPWRKDAISTGMFPLQAIQALWETAKTDIEQVYLPRNGIAEEVAITLIETIDLVLEDVQSKERLVSFRDCLLKATEEEKMHPSVEMLLTKRLTEVQELLRYSRIKHIK